MVARTKGVRFCTRTRRQGMKQWQQCVLPFCLICPSPSSTARYTPSSHPNLTPLRLPSHLLIHIAYGSRDCTGSFNHRSPRQQRACSVSAGDEPLFPSAHPLYTLSSSSNALCVPPSTPSTTPYTPSMCLFSGRWLVYGRLTDARYVCVTCWT